MTNLRKMQEFTMFGAIEAGGTKFICAVGHDLNSLDPVTIPTTTPEQTIRAAVTCLREKSSGMLQAVGIGSFGPVCLDRSSARYGFITSTPKTGWRNTDLAGTVSRALGVPVALETDVNAAAIGEALAGAGAGAPSCLYITVGTGIGGGLAVQDSTLHGITHPEMGHIRVGRAASDNFPGICPFHRDCLEGLASGPAIEARWGARGELLPEDHPAWSLEAHYLAVAVANLVFTVAPGRVVLGGGVMRQKHLYPAIRRRVSEQLAAYIQVPELQGNLEDYIVAPAWGERSGIAGAFLLARDAGGLRPGDGAGHRHPSP